MQQLTFTLSPPQPPSFENFFTARNVNAHAVTALRGLLAPLPTELCILLYGVPGSGRSHLVQATLSAARTAGLSTLCIEPGFCIQPESDALRESALDTDLIAADNVDAMNDTEQIQLFDAFNRQRASGRRFLATASGPAARLTVREDLRTRLASGLALEIAPLSEEERLAVLQQHAADRDIAVPHEVFDYVARRVPRDLGTQLAVLDALDRLSLERHRPLTIALAREALQHLGLTPALRTD
jgi:DnaA-homolog protein